MPSMTDVEKTPLCPQVDDDFTGVAIAVAPRPARNSPLVVHGTYRVPWALADTIEPPLHRALVLVVQNGALHSAVTPFRDKVLFGDDERETPAGVLGHFTMDVFELGEGLVPGDYHLLVSLNELISNVVRVEVR